MPPLNNIPTKWLPGPPTKAGLYWYALLFNGPINTTSTSHRYANVRILDEDEPWWDLKKGDVVVKHGPVGEWGHVEPLHRRWAGPLSKPEPIPSHCFACLKEHATEILCEEAQAR